MSRKVTMLGVTLLDLWMSRLGSRQIHFYRSRK